MTLKKACVILDIEMPNVRTLSDAERELLLADTRKKYHALRGHSMLLDEAFEHFRKIVEKKRLTITELFAQHVEKDKQDRDKKVVVCKARRRTPVFQFSLSGELIQKWPSMAIAAKGIGIDFTAISKSIYAYKGAYSAGGFLWSFTDELKTLRPSKVCGHVGKCLCKTVLQFSKTGELIREWPSMTQASKATGIPHTNISGNVTERVKSAGGFVWKLKTAPPVSSSPSCTPTL